MMLVSKSVFDLVGLRKLSPRIRGWANDGITVARVGYTFWSKTTSTWTGLNVVKVSPVAQGDDNVAQVA